MNLRISRLAAAAILIAGGPAAAFGADPLVYAGTYTRGASRGIYGYRFQAATGRLRPLGIAAEASSPSFLAADPNGRFLYAVNEDANAVSAFAIDRKSGKLAWLNTVKSGGEGPCHLALDKTAHWLAVSNYGSGSMAIMPVSPNGRLGEAATVEGHTGGHAHDAVFSADNRFLLLADLGLDRIFVYRFDAAKGALTANDPPFASVAAGAGVRHLAFHPNGKALYAIDESNSTVTAFRYDAGKGTLDSIQTVGTLPENYRGANTTAEIAVNAAGSVLYGSNRGQDSIALFSIDTDKFTLTAMEYAPTLGKTPRHFSLDPTGGFLIVANQASREIVVFRVHPKTGQLTPVGRPVTDAPDPVCIVFVP